MIGRTSVFGYEETSRRCANRPGAGGRKHRRSQRAGHREPAPRRRAAARPGHPGGALGRAVRPDPGRRLAVQSDIARQIVAAVGATVTGTEAGAIGAVPTQNAEAYQFYLRGLEYQRRPGFRRENLVIAQQLYERALALDSSFALAHAAISYVHTMMFRRMYDRSATRLGLARREADVALRLASGLPQAHLAAGVSYQARGIHRAQSGQFNVRGDFRAALDQLNLGLQGAPNDPDLWASSGWVHCTLAIMIARSSRSTTRGDSTREIRACWRRLGVPTATSVATGRPSRRTVMRSPLPRTSSTYGSIWAGTTLVGRASWTRSALFSRACRLPAIREVEEGPSGANACCCYIGSAARIRCSRSSPSFTRRPTRPRGPP